MAVYSSSFIRTRLAFSILVLLVLSSSSCLLPPYVADFNAVTSSCDVTSAVRAEASLSGVRVGIHLLLQFKTNGIIDQDRSL